MPPLPHFTAKKLVIALMYTEGVQYKIKPKKSSNAILHSRVIDCNSLKKFVCCNSTYETFIEIMHKKFFHTKHFFEMENLKQSIAIVHKNFHCNYANKRCRLRTQKMSIVQCFGSFFVF